MRALHIHGIILCPVIGAINLSSGMALDLTLEPCGLWTASTPVPTLYSNSEFLLFLCPEILFSSSFHFDFHFIYLFVCLFIYLCAYMHMP